MHAVGYVCYTALTATRCLNMLEPPELTPHCPGVRKTSNFIELKHCSHPLYPSAHRTLSLSLVFHHTCIRSPVAVIHLCPLFISRFSINHGLRFGGVDSHPSCFIQYVQVSYILNVKLCKITWMLPLGRIKLRCSELHGSTQGLHHNKVLTPEGELSPYATMFEFT